MRRPRRDADEDEGHHPVRAHAVHEHHEPRKLWPWIVTGVVAAIVIPVAITLIGGGSYYREETAGAMTARAEEQLARGELSEARDTYQLAMLRDPDTEERTRLDALKVKLDAQLAVDRDKPALDLATKSVEVMRDLQTQYPGSARPVPVVRELAKTSKSWLDRFKEVAGKHAATSSLVAEVQSIHDTNRAQAQLERPDDADDILFAVDRSLQGSTPRYDQSLKQIDDYVNTHKFDPKIDAMKTRRAKIVEEARTAYDKHESAVRAALAERKIPEAKKALQSMRNASVVPAWNARADELEREIFAGGK